MLNCSDKCFRVSWEQFTIKDSLHPEYSRKVTSSTSSFQTSVFQLSFLDTVLYMRTSVYGIGSGKIRSQFLQFFFTPWSSISQFMLFIICTLFMVRRAGIIQVCDLHERNNFIPKERDSPYCLVIKSNREYAFHCGCECSLKRWGFSFSLRKITCAALFVLGYSFHHLWVSGERISKPTWGKKINISFKAGKTR